VHPLFIIENSPLYDVTQVGLNKSCFRRLGKQRLGWDGAFTDFIASGKWDVDDVLRPIYEEASRVMGRQFEYPEKN
jgi:hypothetical protein